jgi:hypothetical protein
MFDLVGFIFLDAPLLHPASTVFLPATTSSRRPPSPPPSKPPPPCHRPPYFPPLPSRQLYPPVTNPPNPNLDRALPLITFRCRPLKFRQTRRDLETRKKATKQWARLAPVALALTDGRIEFPLLYYQIEYVFSLKYVPDNSFIFQICCMKFVAISSFWDSSISPFLFPQSTEPTPHRARAGSSSNPAWPRTSSRPRAAPASGPGTAATRLARVRSERDKFTPGAAFRCRN